MHAGQTGTVAVLIDTPVWPWRGRRWSHLVSDVSYDELHAFVAAELGIPRRAFQGDHYDIPEDLYDDRRRRRRGAGRRAGSCSAGCWRRGCGVRKPRAP